MGKNIEILGKITCNNWSSWFFKSYCLFWSLQLEADCSIFVSSSWIWWRIFLCSSSSFAFWFTLESFSKRLPAWARDPPVQCQERHFDTDDVTCQSTGRVENVSLCGDTSHFDLIVKSDFLRSARVFAHKSVTENKIHSGFDLVVENNEWKSEFSLISHDIICLLQYWRFDLRCSGNFRENSEDFLENFRENLPFCGWCCWEEGWWLSL